MKLFVCMFSSRKRTARASTVAALTTWAAIEFLGAPPVILAIVAFGGSLLIAATQDWMRRHPETH